MKTTAVVESLSYFKTNVLFQRIPAYFKMVNLSCSSITSYKIGQAQLKRFPVFYSVIGHSERNSL